MHSNALVKHMHLEHNIDVDLSHQIPPKLGGCSPSSSNVSLPPHLTQALDHAMGQTLVMIVMDRSSGNGKVDTGRNAGGDLKQACLPDFSKIAWIW